MGRDRIALLGLFQLFLQEVSFVVGDQLFTQHRARTRTGRVQLMGSTQHFLLVSATHFVLTIDLKEYSWIFNGEFSGFTRLQAFLGPFWSRMPRPWPWKTTTENMDTIEHDKELSHLKTKKLPTMAFLSEETHSHPGKHRPVQDSHRLAFLLFGENDFFLHHSQERQTAKGEHYG